MKAKLLFSVALFALSTQFSGCGRNEVSFSADIQPILTAACVECHTTTGEGVAASGFAVNDYDSVMKGTELGPVVVAGSSMSSALYLVVAGKTAPEIRMPPHHEESWAEGRGVQLSAAQIESMAAWIDQGAKDN
ncbi:MAG: c-type cytochrome domain-containing protein [Woeseiaceae bacterium]